MMLVYPIHEPSPKRPQMGCINHQRMGGLLLDLPHIQILLGNQEIVITKWHERQLPQHNSKSTSGLARAQSVRRLAWVGR